MTEIATIYVFENENGSKYYQLEELKNIFYNKNIKYDIRFPIKYVLEDINIVKKIGTRHETIQSPGPIVCKNCFIYGSRGGIFMGYCANCVIYDNRPGCDCLTIEEHFVCNKGSCIFKTYLQEIDIDIAFDVNLETGRDLAVDINIQESIKIKEEPSWDVTQQEINERFMNGESDYYIEKEKEDTSSLCAVYNYYSDEDTFDLELELEELKLEETEIPILIAYTLNKYEMVDISVIRERYKEVESQPTPEMMKQKVNTYQELDAKSKEEYEEPYDPFKLHISLRRLYFDLSYV